MSSPCPTCKEYLYKEESWRATREAKRDNFEEYLAECGMPQLFRDAKEILDLRSLFISGGCGVGKTYTAVSILKGFVRNLNCERFIKPFRNTPIFTNVPELLIRIRACFKEDSRISEEKMLERYFNTELLILDDLGIEKTTEWALQSLYVILNKRGGDCKQTIVTSNLSLDEIGSKLSDRIASRIRGMCKVVAVKGRDRRLRCN